MSTLPDRFAQQARERESRADLFRKSYLDTDVPDDVADELFAYAWQEGHAHGWNEVENHYLDLAPIVNKAYQAGWSATR